MVETFGVTFRDAQLLWMLALSPFALLFLWWREKLRRNLSERFASARLRGTFNSLRPVRPFLILVAFTLAVASLAGPRIGYELVPAPQNQNNRIVAIDVSESMAAEDVGTSRLLVAKAVASRLIAAHGGRVGLIAFEGKAQIIAPLTNDHQAVQLLLASVQAGELGEPGSDLGDAIVQGVKLTDRVPNQSSELILISDGEDQGRGATQALPGALQRHLRISTITIGSTAGGRIPLRDRAGFLKDEAGNEVVTSARTEIMKEIAVRSGGVALVNPFAEAAIRALAADGVERSSRDSADMIRLPREQFQWPLAASFLFFLCASVANRGAE